LWYVISLTTFVLALMSKTTTIMLPVVLLGCAAWQRRRITRQDLWHTAPLFLLSLAFGLMSIWYQKHQALANDQTLGGALLPSASFWERLAMAGGNFWFYLGKALLPLHLSVAYLRRQPEITSWTAFLPSLLILVTFAVCWCFRRTWGRHVLFGLGCFLITLFPALGFFDTQFLVYFRVSDHLQYLPLLNPLVLMAAGLATALPQRILPPAAAVLIVILSGYTLLRAQVFSSQESLMRDTLEKNPAAWAAHNDLGVVLAKRNHYSDAETHFTASLHFNPNNPGARLNLSQALLMEGKIEEARKQLELALVLNPANSEFHEKLSSVLAQLGQPQEAIIQLKVALKLAPKAHPNTRMALAGLLYATGDYRGAIAQYHEVLSAEPDLKEALNNLAWLLAVCPDETVRNGTEAVECAERACLLAKFKDAPTVGTLAAAYAEAGRFPEAVVTANFAIQLATNAHQVQFAAINQQLLTYYRAGRPWHEPTAQRESR
jgi:Flp pilus assembly protein TadD